MIRRFAVMPKYLVTFGIPSLDQSEILQVEPGAILRAHYMRDTKG